MPFVVMVYADTPAQARVIRDRYSRENVGRVVAIFELPRATTPVCERPLSCRAGSGWTRNARGAVVHACGRRRRGWRASIGRTLFDMFGQNLYKEAPELFRTPY